LKRSGIRLNLFERFLLRAHEFFEAFFELLSGPLAKCEWEVAAGAHATPLRRIS
jgi:hypothetical protein